REVHHSRERRSKTQTGHVPESPYSSQVLEATVPHLGSIAPPHHLFAPLRFSYRPVHSRRSQNHNPLRGERDGRHTHWRRVFLWEYIRYSRTCHRTCVAQ